MKARDVFGRIADATIRIGTLSLVAQAAYIAARSRDWSPWGIALGALLLVVYGLYLWRCMNAEHALTLLENQVGMKVRLQKFDRLSIGFDYMRFAEFAHFVARELEAQQQKRAA
jgi:hypothetical protein